MSTGQRAFTGNTSGVIFDAILNRSPISPVRLNPLIPLQLEQIISKALEKDRDLRYRTASDIRADLQRLKRDTDSARALPYLSGPSPSRTVRKYWPHFIWAGRPRAAPAPVSIQRGRYAAASVWRRGCRPHRFDRGPAFRQCEQGPQHGILERWDYRKSD